MALNKQKAYYQGTHHNSFRSGELAEIIGLVYINKEDEKPMEARACFHVKYSDGKEDYTPICDRQNYSLYPQESVTMGYKEEGYWTINDDPFAEFRAPKGKFLIITTDRMTGLIDIEKHTFKKLDYAIWRADKKMEGTILMDVAVYDDKGEPRYKRESEMR